MFRCECQPAVVPAAKRRIARRRGETRRDSAARCVRERHRRPYAAAVAAREQRRSTTPTGSPRAREGRPRGTPALLRRADAGARRGVRDRAAECETRESERVPRGCSHLATEGRSMPQPRCSCRTTAPLRAARASPLAEAELEDPAEIQRRLEAQLARDAAPPAPARRRGAAVLLRDRAARCVPAPVAISLRPGLPDLSDEAPRDARGRRPPRTLASRSGAVRTHCPPRARGTSRSRASAARSTEIERVSRRRDGRGGLRRRRRASRDARRAVDAAIAGTRHAHADRGRRSASTLRSTALR